MSSQLTKNILLTAGGILTLLLGVTIVLREWASLIIVFKGFIGVILAVAGIFMLFLVSGKSGKQ